VVYLVTTLLQIFHRMRHWKNFDNRSIFDKDMDKTLWLTFLGPPCIVTLWSLNYRQHCTLPIDSLTCSAVCRHTIPLSTLGLL